MNNEAVLLNLRAAISHMEKAKNGGPRVLYLLRDTLKKLTA